MRLRPTQGDERWVLFGNHPQWKSRPPLCHLDRSSEGAQWRDLRSSQSSDASPCPSQSPIFLNVTALPLSSRPERSAVEGSAVVTVVTDLPRDTKKIRHGRSRAVTCHSELTTHH